MKHIVSILFLIVLFTGNTFAFSVKDSVSKAELAYQDEKYFTAIEVYENILNQGFSSEKLYYNLGNAYYKANNFPKAILHYERCLRLNPNNEDAEFNLNIAKLQQSDKISEIPEFFLLIWYKDFIGILSSNAWAYISICLFIVMLVFVYFYFFTTSGKVKKISFITGLVLLFFFSATVVFSTSLKRIQTGTDQAIIMTPSLTVKSTPADNGKNLFVIHEGLKVRIEDTFNSWVKIKISNGNEGWVRTSDLEII